MVPFFLLPPPRTRRTRRKVSARFLCVAACKLSMFLAVFVDGSVSYMLVVLIETLVSWSGAGVPEGNSCHPFEYIGAA